MRAVGLGRVVLLAVALAAAPRVLAVSLFAVPDVPADLGGATRLPWDIVRKDTPGSWSLAASVPFPTAVDGLHRMDSGDWLISVDAPADLGGTTWLPRDVVRVSGGTYSGFFCGGAVGLAPGVNIDALFLRGGDAGSLVLSFDAPVTIGPVTYDSADLLAFARIGPGCSSWMLSGLLFDASSATPSIAASTNVTGADERGGNLVLTFDVPTTLGATTHLPGDLVAWDGLSFSMFQSAIAVGWPRGAVVNDFSFLADPGLVPPTLTVAHGPSFPSDVTLSWSTSCSSGAENYAIYQGTLGSWYSHTALDCSDDGALLTETVPVGPGNLYYLVVPENTDDEGSYGLNSASTQRPRGITTCTVTQTISSCP